MLGDNTNIDTIKQEVLYGVAKLAFSGELEAKKEALPYELIPGPQAHFRCCIYKEREIIRQRIRLAEGKSPLAGSDNKNVVQVINSACEGCPITRFVVTDNCQKCMGKRCQSACNFGAITMLRDRAHIDPNQCKECGKCSQVCPYNAIADLMRPCKRSCPVDAITMDDNNIVVINEEKCIDCGACIENCPFGAISDRSFMVDVIDLIENPELEVFAMLAPAWEGQFGSEVNAAGMAKALQELGFKDMYEVALGADFTAVNEAAEWAEAHRDGKKMTTSCCPSFVKMVRKHYPKLEPNISTTVSPMTATARLIKSLHPKAVCVFIGPCIAKKGEVIDTIALNGADYALTLDELYAMFRAKNVEPAAAEDNLQQGSIYGKKFCISGGVTASVIQSLKEKEEDYYLSVKACNGAAECKKALLLLKAGKLPEDFIEGMVCEGGCQNGPGSILTGRQAFVNRDKLFAKADDREINENIKQYEELKIPMHRTK
ncbi:4Fe-4S dicluster domain-containing protein [Anaerocolumna sp. AGMB13025]|uniref:4Fe-4S dicluster domain-containing protein n=1 Tax=Anaerocolumna sp. AGMB13025 TaxID=3039116 RepID=UPI00241EAAEB|nr:4Fe-4S dicluster domain-containing protein [Anaerocolumna sp. AGMB13025]WFR57338.1 4Fe-4S dicluster domain-containing protein [Anaerocolumna sp. AGMB13025]